MPDYSLFGLRMRSDRELPGIPEAVGDAAPDVAITLGTAPEWNEAPLADSVVIHQSEPEDDRGPALVATREGTRRWRGAATPPVVRLAFAEGITFWCTLDGRQLWARWDAPLTFADALTFLTGPALGYVLRAQAVLALHASSVVIDGRAIAFIGPGGAGKSTLAAALERRAHGVLTDDVPALRPDGRRWMAQPATPQLKVWSDSAQLLLGDAAAQLAPLSPTWEKCDLPLAAYRMAFHSTAAPLAGLLLIGERASGARRPAIERVGGREAILELVANTYTNYLLDDAQRAVEFAALARLVDEVRIARVHPGASVPDLDATCAAIERWSR